MQDLPHHYKVAATAKSDGDVSLTSDGLNPISSAPPAEFGGLGDQWSPETLLVAAIADCFILAFRAIARASNLPWNSLNCEVTGTLERSGGKTKFTEYLIRAALDIPQDANEDRANRILKKVEDNCLVTNSLSGTKHLEAVVTKAP
jgi:organic hydroperoxide reductase OsmC/OhrA